MTGGCALYRKERSAYFNSPVAYIVTIVFLLLSGYFFAQPLFLMNEASIKSFIELAPLLLVIFTPAITMRHLADEFKSGTIEVLMTLPVDDWKIIASKFAASMTLLAMMLGLTLAFAVTIACLGPLDYGAVACSYIGLFLTGGLLVAAGMFASSLTRNQVVAFIVAFLIGFALFMIGKVGRFMPIWAVGATEFLGLDSHIDTLSRGVLDTRDLLYYFTGIGLFLFMTQARLWLIRAE